MEEDINISDQKSDAFRLITEKGRIMVEEVRPVKDNVVVRGKLCYSILYLSDEEDKKLCSMEGTIPFEEKVYMENVTPNDTVTVKNQLEDLSVGLINSRKISIRTLFLLTLSVDELFDEDAVVEIAGSGSMEVLKKPMNVTVLAVDTKDIFRIKEEVELPNGMPNIFSLIWKDIKLNAMEFRLMDGKVAIQGELSVFYIYEGEGDNNPIRYYEIVKPINGMMDVNGCNDSMVFDISYDIEHEDVEIRPDFDGEERILGIDIAINMYIKLMETQTLQVITDVYGIMQDVEPVLRQGSCKNLLMKNTGKMKVTSTLKTGDENPKILQMCHVDGCLIKESEQVLENGIEVSGVVVVKAIYVTGDDEIPYSCLTGNIPFVYKLDITGINEECSYQVNACIEQLNANMTDGEEMEIKAVLSFQAMAFEKEKEPMLKDVAIQVTDMEKRGSLPGMVVYIAKENDHIWNIGKKYYVPLKSIKEVNNLTKDELNSGDKILVVKEML